MPAIAISHGPRPLARAATGPPGMGNESARATAGAHRGLRLDCQLAQKKQGEDWGFYDTVPYVDYSV